VLRALREAQGVSQEGWAAQLGYGQATVRRWEAGTAVPTAAAEQALISHCQERGLLRTYQQAPLAGVSVTTELLHELLADARLGTAAASLGRGGAGGAGHGADAAEVDHTLLAPSAADAWPAGTVTLLFSDIEGSTHLLQHLGDGYAAVLAEHQCLLRAAFYAQDGCEVSTQGDSFFVVFARATQALAAAVAAQRALAASPWPAGGVVRVRMGMHTGEPARIAANYLGLDVHRAARICAAGHGGQMLLSEPTARLIEADLPAGSTLRDLGHHRLKDFTHPEHLFQLVVPDLPLDFPPLRSLDVRPNNLPAHVTSFIGREPQLAEGKQLLTRTRLLTLTGSGGVGKTRLGLQLAAELLSQQPDGVWLVDVGPLTDPLLILQTVAEVLGVREQPGRPLLDTLIDAMQAKQLLLVLDNCEHLVEACAHVVDALLRACPALTILATSREVLGVAGETVYRVPSLALPAAQPSPSLEALARSEAVQFFTERAMAARPEFTVTDRTAPAVARLCSRLDGIPLALELAAARVRVLSVEQLAARLDDRFRLLTGGSRTAVPRLQTLRAMMDWSYELLSDPERAVFQRLAVFVDGWTLDAAESVCVGDSAAADDVLEVLTHLVDKSLVAVEDQEGEVRHRLLETVRYYSQDLLVASGHAPAARDRHRDWYLALAERAEPELWGTEQGRWLAWLEADHDNLRAALDWSIATGTADAGLRLAGALWKFWEVRGYLREGRGWLERAMAAGGGSAGARARAYAGAGVLARHQGDYGRAVALLEEGLVLCRAEGDRRGEAAALNNLGIVARRQGHVERAAALLEAGLVLRRELGDEHGIASSLHNLGVLARQCGETARAVTLLEECLAVRRALGDNHGIANTLNNLGNVARQAGDLAHAADLLRAGLLLDEELKDKAGIAFGLEGLAAVVSAQGRQTLAARLFGAADVLREGIGAPLSPVDRADHDVAVQTRRESCAAEAFTVAWAAGRALPLEQAVAEALALADTLAEPV
jgi:predicted ATPase/class 3 adenylate cyclase